MEVGSSLNLSATPKICAPIGTLGQPAEQALPEDQECVHGGYSRKVSSPAFHKLKLFGRQDLK